MEDPRVDAVQDDSRRRCDTPRSHVSAHELALEDREIDEPVEREQMTVLAEANATLARIDTLIEPLHDPHPGALGPAHQPLGPDVGEHQEDVARFVEIERHGHPGRAERVRESAGKTDASPARCRHGVQRKQNLHNCQDFNAFSPGPPCCVGVSEPCGRRR